MEGTIGRAVTDPGPRVADSLRDDEAYVRAMRRSTALGGVLAVVLAVVGPACAEDPPPEMPIGDELATLTPSSGTYDNVLPFKGHYLYAGSNDIHIFDVRNGTDPVEVGMMENARTVAVRGDLLYFIRDEGKGAFLTVADISDPTKIKPLAVIPDPEIGVDALRTMREAPSQTVVASKTIGPDDEVMLIDLLHPEKPEQVARFLTAYGKVTSLAIDGEILYVAHDVPPDGTVQVWDVRDWDNPVELGRTTGRCDTMFVVTKGVIYCTYGSNFDPTLPARPILDARDPKNPVFPPSEGLWSQVQFFLPFGPYIAAKQRIVQAPPGDNLAAPAKYVEVFSLFEIRDPLHPRPVQGHDELNVHQMRRGGAADDRFIYLTEGDLKIYARGPGAQR
jgi:hypothetical protein